MTPADGALPAAGVVPAVAASRGRRRPDGPLAGRRILVLGGPHPAVARAREQITSLGGSAAVAAFLLDEYDRVRGAEDFVFYNQPAGGGVELGIDGGAEQSIRIDLADLPGRCVRVRVVAALSGDATFGAVGPVQVQAVPRVGQPFARATLDAATTERTMLLADVYRRGASWRLRVVGQGYGHGLAWLATTYGVRVDD
ncbi:TerD family protein [Polymorphospora rubra]|uniref:TerD domain-containing protein n=1 Tax=Polymorphospora rubra TaxID=338584 RepID=A0A810NCF7_9ACTN|nr:TerD family protein [Polymorphospora rubra]BCJ70024.1 hypothetical protein Prubr_70450 [Polymorphospora rubra]